MAADERVEVGREVGRVVACRRACVVTVGGKERDAGVEVVAREEGIFC